MRNTMSVPTPGFCYGQCTIQYFLHQNILSQRTVKSLDKKNQHHKVTEVQR